MRLSKFIAVTLGFSRKAGWACQREWHFFMKLNATARPVFDILSTLTLSPICKSLSLISIHALDMHFKWFTREEGVEYWHGEHIAPKNSKACSCKESLLRRTGHMAFATAWGFTQDPPCPLISFSEGELDWKNIT